MVVSSNSQGYTDLHIETHRIFGVPTGITAFVGRTLRGPVNHPVRISSFGDFIQTFGGLWDGNALGFTIQDFFRNGGEQAVIVRLFHPQFETMKDRGLALSAGREIAAMVDDCKGEQDMSLPTVIQRVEKRAGYFQREVRAKAAKNIVDHLAKVAMRSGMTLDLLSEIAYESVGSLAPLPKARIKVGTLLLEAANEGAWGNHLQARIDHDRTDVASPDLFTLTVRDSTTGRIEQFRNISVHQEHSRYVARVLANESRLVRIQGILTDERPSAHPIPEQGKRVWGCHASGTISVVGPDDRASDGLELELDDYVGTERKARKQGIYALDEAGLFNMLCVPPPRRITRLAPELIGPAADYCELKRAVLLIDPPKDWDFAAKALKGIFSVGSTSPNAAFLYPTLKRDHHQGQHYYPSGAVAGMIALNDRERGVWHPPVQSIELHEECVPKLSIDHRDLIELTEQNINCLTINEEGKAVLQSNRTLAGHRHPEGSSLAIRRLTLFIEESLRTGLQWALFEPNDISLWSRIRLQVSSFMRSLFQRGAFKGTHSEAAWYVKCGKETTPAQQLERGMVRVLVGFAPGEPGKFIDICLEQMTATGNSYYRNGSER